MPDTPTMLILAAGLGVALGMAQDRYRFWAAERDYRHDAAAHDARVQPFMDRLRDAADDYVIRVNRRDMAEAMVTRAFYSNTLSVAEVLSQMGYRLEVDHA